MHVVRIFASLFIAIGIVAGAHYYIWKRLISDCRWGEPWTAVGTFVLFVLFLGVPGSLFVRRVLPRFVARVVYAPLSVWMGMAFLLVMTLAVSEPLRLVGVNSRGIALAAVVASVMLTFASMASALRTPRVRSVDVVLDRLPRELDGFTLVQLTDVHVDLLVGRRFVERLVARVNGLEPDAVVITGDLVDGTVAELASDVAPLANLASRFGTFFVTGNHEYYGRSHPRVAAEEWIAELSRLGIRVLANERVSIQKGAAALDLAGVHDYSAGRMVREHASSVERAVEGRDPDRVVVLLAHQPRSVLEAERFGVDLQLSGHTHDGQIWPFRYLVKLQQPHVEGLARRGTTQLFTSRGTGFWGPPMRLFAPAEISWIALRCSERPPAPPRR